MIIDVCKFGGSSLANTSKIKHVAEIITTHTKTAQVIVVLSAMQGETERLLNLASELVPLPKGRDLDFLLATGEQASTALMALYLNSLGIKAKAFDARMIGLMGVGSHQSALVKSLDKSAIKQCLAEGIVPIITGFQVVLPNLEVATLERGGSDTSAVALAAAFAANCYIYSDVAGVYSADPNKVSQARQWPEVAYSDMLALSKVGAKVLQYRAIELARKYQVPLILKSTFDDKTQTRVIENGAIVGNFFGLAITGNKYIMQVPEALGLENLLASKVVFSQLQLTNSYFSAVVAQEYLSMVKVLPGVKVSPLLTCLNLVGLQDRYKPDLLQDMLQELANAEIKPYTFAAYEHGLEFWLLAEEAEQAANILNDFSLSDAVA